VGRAGNGRVGERGVGPDPAQPRGGGGFPFWFCISSSISICISFFLFFFNLLFSFEQIFIYVSWVSKIFYERCY
jgi:hypothetical protein